MSGPKDGALSERDLREPAFPTLNDLPATERADLRLGLSVRDWFAGQALAGMNVMLDMPMYDKTYAESAFRIADAMLEARKK